VIFHKRYIHWGSY